MISFFNEEIEFHFNKQEACIIWINKIIASENFLAEDVNFIFCSDLFLLDINRKYLHHDYFTDIITFDLSENKKEITGDIYISIDRIKENAIIQVKPFEDELDRVIIHGILHLMGYMDKSKQEQANMRKKEDACLSLRKE